MSEGIDYFGRGSLLTAIQERISLRVRRRMYLRWEEYAGRLEGSSVLDVGSTPDQERSDSNCMIPWLHASGARVTLYSPEDIRALGKTYPFARILPSAGFGTPIPARDRTFAWTVASAVLEHVGGSEAQASFIAECARVADGLFLTTPNRWHWLEFHTKLPLLHWMPRAAHRAALRRLGREAWARESHLHLVGRRELLRIARVALGETFHLEVTSIAALGMPSNLVLLARRRTPEPGS